MRHNVGKEKSKYSEVTAYYKSLGPLATKLGNGWRSNSRILREYKLTNDQDLRNKIVLGNIRLVLRFACKYWNYCPSMYRLDMIQEGVLGLMRAIDTFDPDMGNKLSTYASYSIRQRMRRFLLRFYNTVHLPQNYGDYFYKIISAVSSGNSADDITDNKNVIRCCNSYMSEWMTKLEDDPDSVVSDRTPQDVILESVEIIKCISDAMKRLKPIQRAVLSALYSIDLDEDTAKLYKKVKDLTERNQSPTLEDVGRCLNLTRERIRQIRNEALKKITLELKNRRAI